MSQKYQTKNSMKKSHVKKKFPMSENIVLTYLYALFQMKELTKANSTTGFLRSTNLFTAKLFS